MIDKLEAAAQAVPPVAQLGLQNIHLLHDFHREATPENILRLIALLKKQHEALENSIDTVANEYHDDWRHGLPSRQKQLDAMAKMLELHREAIAEYEALK